MLFFLASRRRHTGYWRDWSSDVCTSDLVGNMILRVVVPKRAEHDPVIRGGHEGNMPPLTWIVEPVSSVECRVGKVCRSVWSPYLLIINSLTSSLSSLLLRFPSVPTPILP